MTVSKAQRWNIVALALAAVTALGLAFVPFGTSGTVDTSGVETTSSETLLSSEGSGVLIVLAIPLLLIAVPLLLRSEALGHRSRVVITVLLGIFVLLGASSIGVFFIPTMTAILISLAASSPSRNVSVAG